MAAKSHARRIVLAALTLLFALSCTRMPTGPRTQVTVHGTILGPSGEPVPFAWVIFFPEESVLRDSALDTFARTGDDGTYSLKLLPGDYEMHIDPVVHQEWLGYSSSIRVSEEHDQFDYAFHGHLVTGRLLDPEGTVVTRGGVFVQIHSPHPSQASAAIQQGTFSLLLPSGTYTFSAEARDPAFPSRTLPNVPVDSDTTFDLELTGIPIQGTVTGPDGAPFPEARVEIYPRRVSTDDAGAYRIYADPGVQAIRCFPPPDRHEVLWRTVARNVAAPITLDFDLRGVTWSGTVRYAGTLEPAAYQYVEALTLAPDNRFAWWQTGSSGEFTMVLERDRTYDLDVRSPYSHDTDPPEYLIRLHASADTTFDIVIPPPAPQGLVSGKIESNADRNRPSANR